MWWDNGVWYVSKSSTWQGVIGAFCKVLCELWSVSGICLCDVLVCLPVLWLNAYAFWVGEYVCDIMVCARELWLSNGVLWVGEYVCDVMLCVHELCLSSGVVWVGEYDRDIMMFVLELWLTNGVVWDCDVMVLCLAMPWLSGVVVFVAAITAWCITDSSLLDVSTSSGLCRPWGIWETCHSCTDCCSFADIEGNR